MLIVFLFEMIRGVYWKVYIIGLVHTQVRRIALFVVV